ncbi:hypothetical protein C1I95_33355 [Micromonospora craterilacus]|uniref:DUF2637 domain-containing protein n=1 Tax=Micromonospora craterilacus TaxID=1655439 RepID=A0A2W2DWW1_9ACTN|nr:DUF2637 domain-containing protein [Micromonospora craterilacus]PZG04308.1 hypothetical protein C1I95_33355 [Micromonospora craterilacus]
MATTEPGTVTEQFAAEYARNAVPTMLKAIASVKRYNRFVLLGALATSYLHQAHYLWTQNAGYFAYLVPLIFDAAMVSMLTVVRTSGIARDAKRGALVVFAAAALLSATINFASPGRLGLRLVFALVVVLVIGVELVAGRIRPDFAAIEAEASALLTAARDLAAKNQQTTEPIDAPATPEDHTPAPAPAVDTVPAPSPVVDNVPAPSPVVATPPAPTPAVIEAPITPVPIVRPEVPAHLIPTARFVIGRHEQSTGQPITPDELADLLTVAPDIARELLHAINGHSTAINGTPVGGAR